MLVGLLRAEFLVRGARSLKEKRSPVKSLRERLKNKFNCSASEVDSLDKWQRAVIGVAVVGAEEAFLRRSLDEIRRFCETDRELEFVSCSVEVLKHEDDGLSGLIDL